MISPIPVTLLTGFLGSGKTTVLNRLLGRLPLTAVVMNEFGEVGLDHRLLEESRGPLALLSGGCVCCQVQGSLAPTLRNLWMARANGELPPYERLIVETTGIADPAPIVDVLVNDRWLATRHRLDGIVTTVDAQFGGQQLDGHIEAARQVAVADRLLLTKPDLVDEAALARLDARLAGLNPGAPRLPVRHGELDPAAILAAGPEGQAGGVAKVRAWLAAARYAPAARALSMTRPGGAATPHDPRIHAFSLSFDEPLEWGAVAAALEMLTAFRPKHLLRMKAILNLAGESLPTVLHGVQHVLYPPARLSAWPDDDRRSHFVFILDDLEESLVTRLLDDFTQAARDGNPYFPSSSSVA